MEYLLCRDRLLATVWCVLLGWWNPSFFLTSWFIGSSSLLKTHLCLSVYMNTTTVILHTDTNTTTVSSINMKAYIGSDCIASVESNDGVLVLTDDGAVGIMSEGNRMRVSACEIFVCF